MDQDILHSSNISKKRWNTMVSVPLKYYLEPRTKEEYFFLLERISLKFWTKLLQNIMLLTFSCGRRLDKNLDVINLLSVSKQTSMINEWMIDIKVIVNCLFPCCCVCVIINNLIPGTRDCFLFLQKFIFQASTCVDCGDDDLFVCCIKHIFILEIRNTT